MPFIVTVTSDRENFPTEQEALEFSIGAQEKHATSVNLAQDNVGVEVWKNGNATLHNEFEIVARERRKISGPVMSAVFNDNWPATGFFLHRKKRYGEDQGYRTNVVRVSPSYDYSF